MHQTSQKAPSTHQKMTVSMNPSLPVNKTMLHNKATNNSRPTTMAVTCSLAVISV